MPTEIVEVDVTAQLAGFPQVTFGEVMLLGRVGTPTAGFATNTPVQFFSRDEAVTAFGSSTDLAPAVNTVRSVGADFAYGVLVSKDVRQETFPAASSGTLASTGIIDPDDSTTPFAVTVDAASKTVVFTTDDPLPTPTAGTVVVNTKTKDWESAESGTVVFDFATIDTDLLEVGLENVQFEIMHWAGLGADASHFGLLDWLQGYCDANEKMFAMAFPKDSTLTDTANRTAIQGLSSQLTSRHGVAVGYQSGDDAGSVLSGLMSVKKPWFTLLWKQMTGLAQTTYYPRSVVGDPNTANTFEGGDAGQLGPVNVVINVAGQNVLSNGLTTDGIASDWAFADVTRTRNFMVRRIKAALTQLRLDQDKIPYTDTGLALVESSISGVMENLVQIGALSSYAVEMPQLAAISNDDKSNRRLTGIKVQAVLAGDVHTFTVALNIAV